MPFIKREFKIERMVQHAKSKEEKGGFFPNNPYLAGSIANTNITYVSYF
jgi:hypothetical protein